MAFKTGAGDWTEYRKLDGVTEYDFHRAEENGFSPDGYRPYWDRMDSVYSETLDKLKDAQKSGNKFVIFTHGWSTSRIGKTTSRSQVRAVMRSKDSTPYIIRKECIQHDSVFVAAIRPLPEKGV